MPLALAEANRLEQFITDAYCSAGVRAAARLLPGRIREKLARRRKDGLPDNRVRSLWGTAMAESLLIRAGRPRAATYMHYDAAFSRAAARAARSTRTNLFLYSPYAMPAFKERFEHEPRKVLFQFHPHVALESRLLADDARTWPDLAFTEELTSVNAPRSEPDYDRGWAYADHIICASSFTKRSLVQIGAKEEAISVVPYGADPVPPPEMASGTHESFNVLFVGSGIQRKGLHHLLAAWQIASLGDKARLTIVCRVIEPSIRKMVLGTPGTELLTGVSANELAKLYSMATLFCMPSLVEGFGQVYLEALSRGLPVLGTANTCLPDLGSEADGVFCVPAGDANALGAKLQDLSRRLPGDMSLREAARKCSDRFTWSAFRSKIMGILDGLAA